jgi:hypothetical protein
VDLANHSDSCGRPGNSYKSILIKFPQRSVNGAYTKILLVALYRLDKLILLGVLQDEG